MHIRTGGLAVLLGMLCCLTAQAQQSATPGAEPSAQDVYFELLRPQSDDLGHYLGLRNDGYFSVFGVIASNLKVTQVRVGEQATAFMTVHYHVANAPAGMPVVAFRTRTYLKSTWPLHISATDDQGNVHDAYYLPNSEATLARLQFWQAYAGNDPFVNLRLANADGQGGDMQRAEPLFADFIANVPDFLLARHLRALCYWDNGNVEAAQADLQWFADNMPTVFPPCLDLGQLLYLRGDYGGAVKQFQAAVQISPGSAEAHTMLGMALRAQGNPDQAVAQQQAAIQLDASATDAQAEMGLAQLQQGDYDDAGNSLQKANVANPRVADVQFGLAQVYFQRHNWARAWRYVNRGIGLGGTPDPDFIQSLTDNMHQPHQYRVRQP